MMPGPPTSRISDALLLALIGSVMPPRAARRRHQPKEPIYRSLSFDRDRRLIKEGTITF